MGRVFLLLVTYAVFVKSPSEWVYGTPRPLGFQELETKSVHIDHYFYLPLIGCWRNRSHFFTLVQQMPSGHGVYWLDMLHLFRSKCRKSLEFFWLISEVVDMETRCSFCQGYDCSTEDKIALLVQKVTRL